MLGLESLKERTRNQNALFILGCIRLRVNLYRFAVQTNISIPAKQIGDELDLRGGRFAISGQSAEAAGRRAK